MNAENQRLEAQRRGAENWRLWGPYLGLYVSLKPYEFHFFMPHPEDNRGNRLFQDTVTLHA